jgi:hypothetical protein
MWIKSISIDRSHVMPNSYVLNAVTAIDGQDYHAEVTFENNIHDFAMAVESVMVYFGVAKGDLEIKKDGEIVSVVKQESRIIPKKLLKHFEIR